MSLVAGFIPASISRRRRQTSSSGPTASRKTPTATWGRCWRVRPAAVRLPGLNEFGAHVAVVREHRLRGIQRAPQAFGVFGNLPVLVQLAREVPAAHGGGGTRTGNKAARAGHRRCGPGTRSSARAREADLRKLGRNLCGPHQGREIRHAHVQGPGIVPRGHRHPARYQEVFSSGARGRPCPSPDPRKR